MKKNTQPQEETLSLAEWQKAVNNAYTDLLISVALESGFMSGPKIKMDNPWQTLMLGLEMAVHPQKDKVIAMIAEAFEPGKPALARRFAERMWEECAGRVKETGP